MMTTMATGDDGDDRRMMATMSMATATAGSKVDNDGDGMMGGNNDDVEDGDNGDDGDDNNDGGGQRRDGQWRDGI